MTRTILLPCQPGAVLSPPSAEWLALQEALEATLTEGEMLRCRSCWVKPYGLGLRTVRDVLVLLAVPAAAASAWEALALLLGDLGVEVEAPPPPPLSGLAGGALNAYHDV